ncbi:hypothetical protein Gasu2_33500 [Galdieria sulphuraria]|nr:hypothetical protein Gasu2_33500 [Galdieria sulphuraria]
MQPVRFTTFTVALKLNCSLNLEVVFNLLPIVEEVSSLSIDKHQLPVGIPFGEILSLRFNGNVRGYQRLGNKSVGGINGEVSLGERNAHVKFTNNCIYVSGLQFPSQGREVGEKLCEKLNKLQDKLVYFKRVPTPEVAKSLTKYHQHEGELEWLKQPEVLAFNETFCEILLQCTLMCNCTFRLGEIGCRELFAREMRKLGWTVHYEDGLTNYLILLKDRVSILVRKSGHCSMSGKNDSILRKYYQILEENFQQAKQQMARVSFTS